MLESLCDMDKHVCIYVEDQSASSNTETGRVLE